MDRHNSNQSTFKGNICKNYFIKCCPRSSSKIPRLDSDRETLVSKLDYDSRRLKIITECMEKFGFKRKCHIGNEDSCKRMKIAHINNDKETLFVNNKNCVSLNNFVNQINDGCKSNGAFSFSDNLGNKHEKNMSLMIKSFGEKLQNMKNSGCFSVKKDENTVILQHQNSSIPSSDALVYCNKFNGELFSSSGNNLTNQFPNPYISDSKDHKNTPSQNSERKCNIFDICSESSKDDNKLSTFPKDKDLASKARIFNLKLGEIFSKNKTKIVHENSESEVHPVNVKTSLTFVNASNPKKSPGRVIPDECLTTSDDCLSDPIHPHMPSHSSKPFVERTSLPDNSGSQNFQSNDKVSLNFDKFKQIISFKNSIQTMTSSSLKAKSSNVPLAENNVSENDNVLKMGHDKISRIKFCYIKRQQNYLILNKNINKLAKKVQLKYLKMEQQRRKLSLKNSKRSLKNIKIPCNVISKEVDDVSDNLNKVNDGRFIFSEVVCDDNICDSIESSKDVTDCDIITHNRTNTSEVKKCDTSCIPIENENISEDDLLIVEKEIHSEDCRATNSINLDCATLPFNHCKYVEDEDDVENSVLSILSFCKEASDGFLSAQTSSEIKSSVVNNSVCIDDQGQLDDDTFNVINDFTQDCLTPDSKKNSNDVRIRFDPEKCNAKRNEFLLVKECNAISHNETKSGKEHLKECDDVVGYDYDLLFGLKKIIPSDDKIQLDGFVDHMCIQNNVPSIEVSQTHQSISPMKLNSPHELLIDNQPSYPCNDHVAPTTQSSNSNLESTHRYISDSSMPQSNSGMQEGTKDISQCDANNSNNTGDDDDDDDTNNINDDNDDDNTNNTNDDYHNDDDDTNNTNDDNDDDNTNNTNDDNDDDDTNNTNDDNDDDNTNNTNDDDTHDPNLIDKKFMIILSNENIVENPNHNLDGHCDENKHIRDEVNCDDDDDGNNDKSSKKRIGSDDDDDQITNNQISDETFQEHSQDCCMFVNMNNAKNKIEERNDDDDCDDDCDDDDDNDCDDDDDDHDCGSRDYCALWGNEDLSSKEFDREGLFGSDSGTDDDGDDDDDVDKVYNDNELSNVGSVNEENEAHIVRTNNKINDLNHHYHNFGLIDNDSDDRSDENSDVVCSKLENDQSINTEGKDDDDVTDKSLKTHLNEINHMDDYNDEINDNNEDDVVERDDLFEDVGDNSSKDNSKHDDIKNTLIMSEDNWLSDDDNEDVNDFKSVDNAQHRNEDDSKICELVSASNYLNPSKLNYESVGNINSLEIKNDNFIIQNDNFKLGQATPLDPIASSYEDQAGINIGDDNDDQTDDGVHNSCDCPVDDDDDDDDECSCGNEDNNWNDEFISNEAESKINNNDEGINNVDDGINNIDEGINNVDEGINNIDEGINSEVTSRHDVDKNERIKRLLTSESEISGSDDDKDDDDDDNDDDDDDDGEKRDDDYKMLHNCTILDTGKNENEFNQEMISQKSFRNDAHKSFLSDKIFEDEECQSENDNKNDDDEHIVSETFMSSPDMYKTEQNDIEHGCDIHGQNWICDNNNNNINDSSSPIIDVVVTNNDSINDGFLDKTNPELNIFTKLEVPNFDNISIDKNNNDNIYSTVKNPVTQEDDINCGLYIKSDLENDNDGYSKQYNNINNSYDMDDIKNVEKFSDKFPVDLMTQYAEMYNKINNSMNIYQCYGNSMPGFYGNFDDVYCDFPENQVSNIYKHYFLAKNYRDLYEAYDYANSFDIFKHYNDLIKIHSRPYPYENNDEEHNGLDLRIKTNQVISETRDQYKIDENHVPMDLIVNKEIDVKDDICHNRYHNSEDNNSDDVIDSKYSLWEEVHHRLSSHGNNSNDKNDKSDKSDKSEYLNFARYCSNQYMKVDKDDDDDDDVDHVSIGDFVDFGASSQDQICRRIERFENNADYDDGGEYVNDFEGGGSRNMDGDAHDEDDDDDKKLKIHDEGGNNLGSPVVDANYSMNKDDHQDDCNVNNDDDDDDDDDDDSKDDGSVINKSGDDLGDNGVHNDSENSDDYMSDSCNNEDINNGDCLFKHIDSEDPNAIECHEDLSIDHGQEFSQNLMTEKDYNYVEVQTTNDNIPSCKDITSLPISFVLETNIAKVLEPEEIGKLNLNLNEEVMYHQQHLSCPVEEKLSDESICIYPTNDHINSNLNSKNCHMESNNKEDNNNNNRQCDKLIRNVEDNDKLCDISDGNEEYNNDEDEDDDDNDDDSSWSEISCNDDGSTKHIDSTNKTSNNFKNAFSSDDDEICIKIIQIDNITDPSMDNCCRNEKNISVDIDSSDKDEQNFEATSRNEGHIEDLNVKECCVGDQDSILANNESVTHHLMQNDFSNGDILDNDDNKYNNIYNSTLNQELINIKDGECFEAIFESNLRNDGALLKESFEDLDHKNTHKNEECKEQVSDSSCSDYQHNPNHNVAFSIDESDENKKLERMIFVQDSDEVRIITCYDADNQQNVQDCSKKEIELSKEIVNGVECVADVMKKVEYATIVINEPEYVTEVAKEEDSVVDVVKELEYVADGCNPFSDVKISTNPKLIVKSDEIEMDATLFEDSKKTFCCEVVEHEDKSGCCIVSPVISEEMKNIDVELIFKESCTKEMTLNKSTDELHCLTSHNFLPQKQNCNDDCDNKLMDSTDVSDTKDEDCLHVLKNSPFFEKYEDDNIEKITTSVNNDTKDNPLNNSEYLKCNSIDLTKLDFCSLFEKCTSEPSSTPYDNVSENKNCNRERIINDDEEQFEKQNCNNADEIHFTKLDETLNASKQCLREETLKHVDDIPDSGKHSSLFFSNNSVDANSIPLDQASSYTKKLGDESRNIVANNSEGEKSLTHLLDGFEFSSEFSCEVAPPSNSNSSLNNTSKMIHEGPEGDDSDELQAAVESILNIDFFSTKYVDDPVEPMQYDYFVNDDELILPTIKERDPIDFVNNGLLNEGSGDVKDIEDEEDEASRDGKELAMQFYSSCQKKQGCEVFDACSIPSDIFHNIPTTSIPSSQNRDHNASQVNKSNFFKSFKSKWMSLNSSESQHFKLQNFEKISNVTNINKSFSMKNKRWKNKRKQSNQFNLSWHFSRIFIRKYQKLNFFAQRRKEIVQRWKRKYVKDLEDLNHLIVCFKNKLYIGYEPSEDYSLNEYKNKNIFYLGSPCGMSSCSFLRESEREDYLEGPKTVGKVLLKKPLFVYENCSLRRPSFVKLPKSKLSSIECQQFSSPIKTSVESSLQQNPNLSCSYNGGKIQNSQNVSCLLSDAFKSSFEVIDNFRDCDYPLVERKSIYCSDNLNDANRLSQGSCQVKFKNETELKCAIPFYEEPSNISANLGLRHDPDQYNLHSLPCYTESNNDCSSQKGKQVLNRPIRPTPLYNGGFPPTVDPRFSNYKLSHFTTQIPMGKPYCLPVVENIYSNHQSVIPSESSSSATFASQMKTSLQNHLTSRFSSVHSYVPNFNNQKMAYNQNDSFNYMEHSSRNALHPSHYNLQHKYLRYANLPASYRYPVSYPNYCSSGTFVCPQSNIVLQETSSSAEIADDNHRTALMKSHLNEKESFEHSRNHQLNSKNVFDLREVYKPRFPANPSMYDTYKMKRKKIVDKIPVQELGFPKNKIEKSKEAGMHHLNIMHNVLSKNGNSRLGRASHKANYQIENILMNPGNGIKSRSYKQVMPSLSLDQSNPSISHSYYQTSMDAGFTEIPIYKFYATPERMCDYSAMNNNNIEHHNPSHPHNYRSHVNLSNMYRNSLSSNKFNGSYYKDY